MIFPPWWDKLAWLSEDQLYLFCNLLGNNRALGSRSAVYGPVCCMFDVDLWFECLCAAKCFFPSYSRTVSFTKRRVRAHHAHETYGSTNVAQKIMAKSLLIQLSQYLLAWHILYGQDWPILQIFLQCLVYFSFGSSRVVLKKCSIRRLNWPNPHSSTFGSPPPFAEASADVIYGCSLSSN